MKKIRTRPTSSTPTAKSSAKARSGRVPLFPAWCYPPRRTLKGATIRSGVLKLKKGQKINVDMGGPEGVSAYCITRLVEKKDGTTVMYVEELGTLPTLRNK